VLCRRLPSSSQQRLQRSRYPSPSKLSTETGQVHPGLDINATTTIIVRWQDALGANKSTTKALNKTNC
jgi:hypothetical protein